MTRNRTGLLELECFTAVSMYKFAVWLVIFALQGLIFNLFAGQDFLLLTASRPDVGSTQAPV
jgi:hypothetical protein